VLHPPTRTIADSIAATEIHFFMISPNNWTVIQESEIAAYKPLMIL
jgi:hypothetical protein